MTVVTVRYFAAAREAAGVRQEQVAAGSTNELVGVLGERHGERMRRVLAISTLLVAGERLGSGDPKPLADDDLVDVLPPFAGG